MNILYGNQPLGPVVVIDDKQLLESQLTESMENELTDEQLQQLAEGSCSWGANCHSGGGY